MLTGTDSRRGFLKKSVYVVPAIVTLNVALVEARAGSDMSPEPFRGGDMPRGQRDGESRPTRDSRDTGR